MKRSAAEIMMGFAVLAIALGFGFYAYKTADIRTGTGPQFTAHFDNIDGIGIGSDVRVGGIKIGVVDKVTLDPKTYEAVVAISLTSDVPLPMDSSAAVVSEGLLGSKYIAIEPGAEEMLLANGDRLMFTQSAVNLESLLGRFIFSGDDESDSSAMDE